MANRYELQLSAKGVIETFGSKIDARELDLNILENLFCLAANSLKDAKAIHVCIDFVDQVKALRGNVVKSVILDDTDKANLEKGIEASSGQRPLSWYASPLWKQFDCMVKPPEAK
jgi:hypothetical protein